VELLFGDRLPNVVALVLRNPSAKLEIWLPGKRVEEFSAASKDWLIEGREGSSVVEDLSKLATELDRFKGG
jgi:hypothetical protein